MLKQPCGKPLSAAGVVREGSMVGLRVPSGNVLTRTPLEAAPLSTRTSGASTRGCSETTVYARFVPKGSYGVRGRARGACACSSVRQVRQQQQQQQCCRIPNRSGSGSGRQEGAPRGLRRCFQRRLGAAGVTTSETLTCQGDNGDDDEVCPALPSPLPLPLSLPAPPCPSMSPSLFLSLSLSLSPPPPSPPLLSLPLSPSPVLPPPPPPSLPRSRVVLSETSPSSA